MKLYFNKITQDGVDFIYEEQNCKISGKANPINKNLVKLLGKLEGKTTFICSKCGDEEEVFLNEELEVYASNGIMNINHDEELLNIIEFFNNQINLEDVFISEFESYKSDYFYCKKCKE